MIQRNIICEYSLNFRGKMLINKIFFRKKKTINKTWRRDKSKIFFSSKWTKIKPLRVQ